MNLTLIAAVSRGNVLGKNNRIPWYVPEDLKHFKELTTGHPIIMGKNTYDSIPDQYRPLVKRKNIVLSRTMGTVEGIHIARTMDEALKLTDNKDAYVIGGEQVYNLFFPIADKIEITRIDREYEGDVFFPELDWEEWNLIKEKMDLKSKNEGIPYSFLTYFRK